MVQIGQTPYLTPTDTGMKQLAEGNDDTINTNNAKVSNLMCYDLVHPH